MKRFKDYFLLLVFSLITILIRGYEYATGNQLFYLTYLNYNLHPELFSKDYLFKIHKLGFSVFNQFIKLMPPVWGSREIPVFLAYLFTLFLFYLAIFKIIDYLFKNKKLAWLSLVLFIYPIPIGLSSISLIEKSLIPRFIADVFLLYSVLFLIKKRSYLSGFIAFIGFLFHPLTLIIYPAILVFLLPFNYLKRKKILITLALFVLALIPIITKFLSNEPNSEIFIDPAWRQIILERLSYVFALKWPYYAIIPVGLIPFIFRIYEKYDKSKVKINPVVGVVIFSTLFLFFINIVSDILSFHLGIELQLTRSLYLAVVFSVIYLSHLIYKSKTKAFPIFIIIVSLIIIILTFKNRLSSKSYAFNIPIGYKQVAIWAKNNTAKNSLFMVPPELSGFRLIGSRSVVVEHKEGGESLYSRRLALEWDKRQKLLKNYYQLDTKKINLLENEFGINFIVTTQSLSYPLSFSSGNWKIYKIN